MCIKGILYHVLDVIYCYYYFQLAEQDHKNKHS